MKRKVISMILRRWKGFCLAAEEEALFPRGAEMCGEVFAPLVFLVRRDPLRARGLYPICLLYTSCKSDSPVSGGA